VVVVRVRSGTSFNSIIERSRAYCCEGEVLLELPHDGEEEEEQEKEQNDGAVDRETLKIKCQLTDVVTDCSMENARLIVTFKSPYLMPPPTTSPPVH
jgi:hypothetical protein